MEGVYLSHTVPDMGIFSPASLVVSGSGKMGREGLLAGPGAEPASLVIPTAFCGPGELIWALLGYR